MTNSDLFKQAHALTKTTIKAGDNYQVTFGLCLKYIRSNDYFTVCRMTDLPGNVLNEIDQRLWVIRKDNIQTLVRYFKVHDFPSAEAYGQFLSKNYKHSDLTKLEVLKDVISDRFHSKGMNVESWMNIIPNVKTFCSQSRIPHYC